MTDSEYETESEYKTESEDETYMCYNKISNFNSFNRCKVCNEVKNKQQGKCDALHDTNDLIAEYDCCDTCCKSKMSTASFKRTNTLNIPRLVRH